MSVNSKKALQIYLTTPNMDNPDVEFCLTELQGAIESLSLPPDLESSVIKSAKLALIKNWNGNNPPEDQLPEEEVLHLIEEIKLEA